MQLEIEVNGRRQSVKAVTLAEAMSELGFSSCATATAVNGDFVPAAMRGDWPLHSGDRIEVLAPMQGG